MKVLELFSGTECISEAFRSRGHECYTVDWDVRFPSSLHIDIMDLTSEMVLEAFGEPDVVWSGNDCTCFSVASIGFHRRANRVTGNLDPTSERAQRADAVNRHSLDLIRELHPRFFFVENPVGALRKMDYMHGIPRYTTTWCQYGFPYRKATDIWTNHPNPQFKPPCRNGDPCHESAPRGSKTGLQGIADKALRSAYPKAFCEHIVDICEQETRDGVPCRFGQTITCHDLFSGMSF